MSAMLRFCLLLITCGGVDDDCELLETAEEDRGERDCAQARHAAHPPQRQEAPTILNLSFAEPSTLCVLANPMPCE